MNWYRKTETGRVEIRQDNIKYIFSRYRRQLTIKDPVRSDSGMYECEAVFNRTGGPTFPAAVARANLTVLGELILFFVFPNTVPYGRVVRVLDWRLRGC